MSKFTDLWQRAVNAQRAAAGHASDRSDAGQAARRAELRVTDLAIVEILRHHLHMVNLTLDPSPTKSQQWGDQAVLVVSIKTGGKHTLKIPVPNLREIDREVSYKVMKIMLKIERRDAYSIDVSGWAGKAAELMQHLLDNDFHVLDIQYWEGNYLRHAQVDTILDGLEDLMVYGYPLPLWEASQGGTRYPQNPKFLRWVGQHVPGYYTKSGEGYPVWIALWVDPDFGLFTTSTWMKPDGEQTAFAFNEEPQYTPRYAPPAENDPFRGYKLIGKPGRLVEPGEKEYGWDPEIAPPWQNWVNIPFLPR